VSNLYRVCTECGNRRQIPWHLAQKPDHQPGVYVCKWCTPTSVGPRYITFDNQAYQRAWNLLQRYGLTVEQYEAKLAEQGGVCAICKQPPKRNRLHVDHDHDCDQGHDPKKACERCFRGLLCVTCNSRLEWLLEFFEPALLYVKRVRARPAH
jgi:recombination endonuclease VII